VNVPELHTERLLMRGFREQDDFDGWAEIAADSEVTRWVGDPDGLSREEAWRRMAYFVGHWELRGFGQWMLVEQATGELVGRAGLYLPEGWPGLEVGWMVARPHWGRGFAPEAGRAAIEWARDELEADHIISLIEPINERSARVAEKLGMTVEGHTKIVNGEIEVRIFGMDLGSPGS
jgi:RimJ/RimL family protein N-acetyltransferase